MKFYDEKKEAKFDLSVDPQDSEQKIDEYLSHAICKEGKPCTFICCSEHCESQAAICADMSCSCHSQHDADKLCSNKKLSAVVKKIQSRKQSFPDLLKWINVKYDELIDWLSEEREKICLRVKSAGITDPEMNFLATVYAGKCEELTGKKAYEVVKDLNSEKQKIEQKETLIINQISQKWEESLDKVRKEVSVINRLISDVCRNDFSVMTLDSKIVATVHDRAIVTEMLNENNRKVLKYEFLYRASENNFEVSKFWEKCNHKADTLTLIYTEFDKVIGGYTPLSWKKEKHGSYEEDSSLRSFVFSVTERAKFTLKEADKENAIRHNTDSGPTFGWGHDISVSNNANSNKSQANIGHSYENSKLQQRTKEGWRFFIGSSQDFFFRVKEWEVWQVIFE